MTIFRQPLTALLQVGMRNRRPVAPTAAMIIADRCPLNELAIPGAARGWADSGRFAVGWPDEPCRRRVFASPTRRPGAESADVTNMTRSLVVAASSDVRSSRAAAPALPADAETSVRTPGHFCQTSARPADLHVLSLRVRWAAAGGQPGGVDLTRALD